MNIKSTIELSTRQLTEIISNHFNTDDRTILEFKIKYKDFIICKGLENAATIEILYRQAKL